MNKAEQNYQDAADQQREEYLERQRKLDLDKHRVLEQLVEREVIHLCSNMISQLQETEEFLRRVAEEIRPRPIRIEDCTLIDDGTLDTVVEVLGETYRYGWEGSADYRDEFDGMLDQDEFFSEVAIPDAEAARNTEVLEYWIVTQRFAEHLKDQGQVVGQLFDFHIWGRTTSGQAICVDAVIERIARSMEILPGQALDWSRS